MFIYNVKLDKNAWFKAFLVFLAIVCIALAFVAIYKICSNFTKSENFTDYECLPNNKVANIQDKNYSNVLKMVNENLDTYIGQQICFTGYVYRVSDIKENEFVLARDMVIGNSPKQTVVVGFLCSYEKAKEFENNTWVNVTGTIEKGEYCGTVPLLKINKIERTSKPEISEVPIPDDYYVPTAVIY